MLCKRRTLCPLIERNRQLGLAVQAGAGTCDAMTSSSPRKGFLPLENVLKLLPIMTSASVSTGRALPLRAQYNAAADPHPNGETSRKTGALMFSGTTLNGAYGEWQDFTHRLHHSAQKA